MKEKIKQIEENAIKQINEAKDLKELNDLRVKYLGKKGELTAVLRGMADLLPEERPIIGNIVNSVKEDIEEIIQKNEEIFKAEEKEKKLKEETIDISLASTKTKRGSKHPLNRTEIW